MASLQLPPCHPTEPTKAPLRVLFFLVVSAASLRHSSATAQRALDANFSLYVAHTDASRATYRRLCKSWYERAYESADSLGESRASIILSRLVKPRAPRLQLLREFTHVWLADEDVSVGSAASMRALASTAHALRLPIAQHAAYGGSHHGIASPTRGCAVKATDFVERISPLISSCVLVHVFGVLYEPRHVSEWGIDRLWCGLAGRMAAPASAAQRVGALCSGVCGVIDTGDRGYHFTRRRGAAAVGRAMGSSRPSIAGPQLDDDCLRARYPTLVSRCRTMRCISRNLVTLGSASAADSAATPWPLNGRPVELVTAARVAQLRRAPEGARCGGRGHANLTSGGSCGA